MKKEFAFPKPNKTVVRLDETSVFISKKGEKAIPFSSISAVELKNAGALSSGYLKLNVIGSSDRLGTVYIASQDENAVKFSKKYEPLALELKEIIEQKIADSSQLQKNIQSNVSVADELMKLKSLLDSGVLTQSEFDEQKAKLIK